MTAVPAYIYTWKQLLTAGVPGVRASFVSLIDASQQAAFQLKNFLMNTSGATTKFTHLWSASAGTGPANAGDHTDRINVAGDFAPRATIAGASQGWYVLESGQVRPLWQATHAYNVSDYVTNGGNLYICRTAGTSAGSGGPTTTSQDITDGTAHWQYLAAGTGKYQLLVCFQGGSDDIFRVSISPRALFTLAGTTNNQPTATDELVMVSATSIVNNTATADRIIQAWVTDDGTSFRFVVFRQAAMAGPAFGVDVFTEGVTNFPAPGSAAVATVPVNVFAFAESAGSLTGGNWIGSGYSPNANGGLTRTLVSSVEYTPQAVLTAEGPAGQNIAGFYSGLTLELHGNAWVPWPIALHTNNLVGSRGRLGNLPDWYAVNPTSVALGDGFGSSYEWIQMFSALWPNPSLQPPLLS